MHDGFGIGVLAFFVLLNNFFNGRRGLDEVFLFHFSLIDGDFFFALIRFLCFDS